MKPIATALIMLALSLLLSTPNLAQDAPEADPAPKKIKDLHAPREGVSNIELMQMDLGPDIKVTSDIQYSDSEDIQRQLDIYAPKKAGGKDVDETSKLPVVVFLHGGNWAAFGGDKRHGKSIASGLCHEGFIVASVTYRGASGSKASQYPRFVRDSAAGVAWVVENIASYGGDKDKLFLSGHSAGGHIAALLAYDTKWLTKHKLNASKLVKGVVGLSGIYYIPSNADAAEYKVVAQMLNGPFATKASTRRTASPITHISPNDPPTLLLYGDEDFANLDRVAMSCWVCLRAMKVEASQHMIANHGHEAMLRNFGVRGNETTKKTLAFLKARLAALKAE